VDAGALSGEVLSTEGTKASGVSESVDGATAARVSTVIVVGDLLLNMARSGGLALRAY
jgi:hypothetical protein